MKLKRMDNVGIVVKDIDAAIQFFTELGLTLEGRMPIDAEWASRVTGVRGQRVVIAMLRTLTHAEVKVRPEEGYWRVNVVGSLTFVSSAKVIRELSAIEPRQHMSLDLHLHFMDMAGWKNLMDWCAEYRRNGGQVDMHGFMDPITDAPPASQEA